ncbi:hypothetical protein [Novosphingobium sp. AP12]|uniref:hypothetical protein n=1 Tax=Novosphingobium sp. AP12 TaxID=1144305 RepID=UPI000271DE1D|nr:hypothetical protein [Novosphingobium sp. AP12]EJL20429.1 hypothetical protein PMI02_05548 [Novosphingobium sp. AP12]
MSTAIDNDRSSDEIEVKIIDPDLVVRLEVDYTEHAGEWVEVLMQGRSPDMETTFPISITFFTLPGDVEQSEHDRVLTFPKTEHERASKIGCRVPISDMAMHGLLALIESGHRRTFSFSAVPHPKQEGLLIENFEFYLEPKPDPRSIH